MRIGVRSTAWDLTLTGRFRRRLRKKEKKKIDKVRAGFSLNPSRGRDVLPSRALPSRALPSPQARAMIEYHKCRVSSFSNWGKAASPEKLKHEAAVAALTAQIQLIELEASQRDPLF